MATSQNPIQKSFSPNKKIDINYLSKDFGDFKQNLINFAQTYYPQTYKDFNDASPGMMFIEMAAYVGDVLSFYIDYQFKESTLLYTEERKNIINLARSLGYKVKASSPAYSTLQVFQLVPSTTDTTGSFVPDLSYAETITEGMEITGRATDVYYRTLSPVDFSLDTDSSPLTISVYSRDNTGKPLFYLLQKTVNIAAGRLTTTTFTVGQAAPYTVISLPEDNVVEILNIVDSNGNTWYEVDYLAQDLIFTEQQNVSTNNQLFSDYNDTVSYLLDVLRTSKRFISYVDENNITNIEFGAGTEASDDEVITVNLNTIGRDLNSNITLNSSYDPTNFLKTKSYGEAPSNTTLTVSYIVGGGIGSNVNTNDLNKINTISFANDISSLPQEKQQLINTLRQSITATNITPGLGGSGAETVDQIRLNAIANFSSQKRAVTREDYIVRALSMPSKYGSIAKVHVVADGLLDSVTIKTLNQQSNVVSSDANNNPFAINMYVLGYDQNQNLVSLNPAVQQNLVTYLNQYRLLTDAINIINGFVINIGVDFEIIVYKNYNKKQVLANAITAVANFFSSDKWTFSQPINMSNIELEIAKVEGVQSVQSLTISNLTSADGNYSPCVYNIDAATVNNIVYPSLDPSVFEVKFPSQDITGRCS